MAQYLTDTEADAIAAELPNVAAYTAATSGQKNAALLLASMRVDASQRWQGRRYLIDGTQELEFPRVPYESNGTATAGDGITLVSIPDEVWDWDADADEAVVPTLVKWAVIFEADSILLGDRSERIQAIADGLASQSIGSASEAYFQTAGNGIGRDGRPSLCVEATGCMSKFRLRQGKIL